LVWGYPAGRLKGDKRYLLVKMNAITHFEILEQTETEDILLYLLCEQVYWVTDGVVFTISHSSFFFREDAFKFLELPAQISLDTSAFYTCISQVST
jgi:hypothetical protein